MTAEAVTSIAVANPVPVAGPRCDGVVRRWTLGSGVPRTPSTSLTPTAFSRGQTLESA